VTHTLFVFSLRDLETGRHLGLGGICPTARYCSFALVGADRPDRRHPESTDWRTFEREALSHYPATPLESAHIAVRMLVPSWHRSGTTVQFASTLPIDEESRLGREMVETMGALKRLITAGIRVFYYLEDKERTLDSPIEKATMALETFGAELERDKARQRTYDAMQRKARANHVTGGRAFGYRNVDVPGIDGRRSHVVREIEPAEAAVIVRIFKLCEEGFGKAAIAKLLNSDGAPAPRSQQGRPRAWGPSTVREVLYRDL
jgi:DNA invertase Pin-like site-specific DNA recombinase